MLPEPLMHTCCFVSSQASTSLPSLWRPEAPNEPPLCTLYTTSVSHHTFSFHPQQFYEAALFTLWYNWVSSGSERLNNWPNLPRKCQIKKKKKNLLVSDSNVQAGKLVTGVSKERTHVCQFTIFFVPTTFFFLVRMVSFILTLLTNEQLC